MGATFFLFSVFDDQTTAVSVEEFEHDTVGPAETQLDVVFTPTCQTEGNIIRYCIFPRKRSKRNFMSLFSIHIPPGRPTTVTSYWDQ